MTYVQSFYAVTPSPRYDDVAWTDLEIWESETEDGTYAQIDDQAIAIDATPASPNTVEITTTLAAFAVGFYKFRFKDATPAYSNFTAAVLAPAGADGTVYFTVAELRAAYTELVDQEEYPDATLAAKIAQAAQAIEDACDVAFVPRERTIAVTNPDQYSGELVLPNHRVREVLAAAGSSAGELDVDDVQIIAGSNLKRLSGWPAGETITVTYSHGHDEPPLRILEAAKLYARVLAVTGPVDKRATQEIRGDGGVINLLTPGFRGSITGIPEVDAAIEQYRVIA